MNGSGIKQYCTPVVIQFPGYECMDDLPTERSSDLQGMWIIDMLGFFLDMLSIGVSYNQPQADVQATGILISLLLSHCG